MTGLEAVLPFVLILGVFWFVLIRPQRKRQLEVAAVQRAVAEGDEVMLGAGIVGTVRRVEDEFVSLEVSPGVEMRVARGAVMRRLVADEPEELDGPGATRDDTDPTQT